jgi:hypothetical protein
MRHSFPPCLWPIHLCRHLYMCAALSGMSVTGGGRDGFDPNPYQGSTTPPPHLHCPNQQMKCYLLIN